MCFTKQKEEFKMKKTYIKGINLATIKSGDKVWCKQDERSETEEGVVTCIEGRMLWADYGDGHPEYILIIVQDNSGVTKYGFMYGTVVEEEEEETVKRNKHPQHEVIVHWANGGAIQYYNHVDERWLDYTCEYSNPPAWNNYVRIKPKTKEIKYRVALMNDNTIKVFNEDISLEDDYDFKHWLDPEWRYVSVEI